MQDGGPDHDDPQPDRQADGDEGLHGIFRCLDGTSHDTSGSGRFGVLSERGFVVSESAIALQHRPSKRCYAVTAKSLQVPGTPLS